MDALAKTNDAPPKKVLIIEDDKAILDVLTYKIIDAGYQVSKAQDGREGLDLALKEHPDLILLDLLIPKEYGLNVLDDLRKDKWGQHVPVFVLTNLSESKTIYKSVVLKADAYFIKSDNTLEVIVTEIKKKLAQ